MATAIGKYVDRVAKGVFNAHGFAYVQILSNWEAIVGSDLAAYCQPSRLRWPSGQERMRDERRRLGGTLVLRVEGPVAVELQHQTPWIIDRINTYYGYQAVTALKIVQGTIDRGLRKRKAGIVPVLPPEQELELQVRLRGVSDEGLRASLLRLGRGAVADCKDRRNRSG